MYRPRPAVERDLQAFHAEDYVHFLRSVTPDNKVRLGLQLQVSSSLLDLCLVL